MQAAVRSYKTMGVALVGASVVAVSPMAPPLPHDQVPALNVSSVAVELSALSNPITQWAQLVQTTMSNIEQLGQTAIANPAPILGQVVTNQVASAQVLAQVAQAFGQGFAEELGNTPGEFQAAFQQIASGDITNGLVSVFNAATGPVLVPILNIFLFSSLGDELMGVIAKPFDNLAAAANVLTATNNLLPLLLSPLNQVQNLADVVGPRAEAMVAAVQQKDPAAFANAIIGLAPALVGAIINGDPTLLPSQGSGLFGPIGPLAAIQTLAQQVAKAINPATTAKSFVAANELPAASVNLVTLDAASPAKAIAAPAAAAKTVTMDPASPAKDVNAVAPTAISGAATSEASATAGTAVGAQAEPGKTGTSATKPSRVNPAKDISDGIRKALKHLGDGSTNAAAGIGAKSSSTSTGNSKSSAGRSNGGGKHRANK